MVWAQKDSIITKPTLAIIKKTDLTVWVNTTGLTVITTKDNLAMALDMAKAFFDKIKLISNIMVIIKTIKNVDMAKLNMIMI